MKKIIPIAFLLALCTVFASANDQQTAPEGARLIAEGYNFPEGPAIDHDGNLFFTDVRDNKILLWNGESVEISLEDTKGANGLAFDKEGNLYACQGPGKAVVKITPEKDVSTVIDEVDGKSLNAPNDLVFGNDGTIYFTNPGGGDLPSCVIRLAPDGTTKIIDDEPMYPNGIGISPEGKWLYVNDTMSGSTLWRYPLNDDGSAGEGEAFVKFGKGGPDGMAVAASGNLYLAMNLGANVTVVNPDGEIIKTYAFSSGSGVTNVCFGGGDFKTLYVTLGNAGEVYSLQVDESGLKPYSHR